MKPCYEWFETSPRHRVSLLLQKSWIIWKAGFFWIFEKLNNFIILTFETLLRMIWNLPPDTELVCCKLDYLKSYINYLKRCTKSNDGMIWNIVSSYTNMIWHIGCICFGRPEYFYWMIWCSTKYMQPSDFDDSKQMPLGHCWLLLLGGLIWFGILDDGTHMI